MDIKKQIFDLLSNSIGPAAIIGLVGFILRHKISNFFQKDMIKIQNKFNMELEAYKATLLNELEEYKLNIDIKRNFALEVTQKRLIVYQSTFAAFLDHYQLMVEYNKMPSKEQCNNAYQKSLESEEKALKLLRENFLYFDDSIISKLQEAASLGKKINAQMHSGQKIEVNLIKNFNKILKELKEAMMEGIAFHIK